MSRQESAKDEVATRCIANRVITYLYVIDTSTASY